MYWRKRKMANKRELSHKYLEGKTKYEFCPYCVGKKLLTIQDKWFIFFYIQPLKLALKYKKTLVLTYDKSL